MFSGKNSHRHGCIEKNERCILYKNSYRKPKKKVAVIHCLVNTAGDIGCGSLVNFIKCQSKICIADWTVWSRKEELLKRTMHDPYGFKKE